MYPDQFADREGLQTMYRVRVRASKVGSIGAKYVELRYYEIETEDPGLINQLAIAHAYREGLEHVLVTNVSQVEYVHD